MCRISQLQRLHKNPGTTMNILNCKSSHPANYSQCPALLAFLAKRNAQKILLQTNTHPQYLPPLQALSNLKKLPRQIIRAHTNLAQIQTLATTQATYAKIHRRTNTIVKNFRSK